MTSLPNSQGYTSLADALASTQTPEVALQEGTGFKRTTSFDDMPTNTGTTTSNSKFKDSAKAAASFTGSSIKGLSKFILKGIAGSIFGGIATAAIIGNLGLSGAALIAIGIGIGVLAPSIFIIDFLCVGLSGKMPKENILETSLSVTAFALAIPLGACALSQTALAGVAFASGKAFQATSFKLNTTIEQTLQGIAEVSIAHLFHLKGMFDTDPTLILLPFNGDEELVKI